MAVLWVAVAALGLLGIVMAQRVYRDDDWDRPGWWARRSVVGALFSFAFPVTKGAHTRRAERTNAAIVMIWGAVFVVAGVALTIHVLS